MDETNTSEHNIQVESDNEEIPGGGKQASGSVYVVSKKTTCWLFFEVPQKVPRKVDVVSVGNSIPAWTGRIN